MKLQSLADGAQYALTGYGPGYLEVNRVRHATGLLVAAQGEMHPWPVTGVEGLGPADFERMLNLRPEVVLLGTGDRQRFVHPRRPGNDGHRCGLPDLQHSDVRGTSCAGRAHCAGAVTALGRAVLSSSPSFWRPEPGPADRNREL